MKGKFINAKLAGIEEEIKILKAQVKPNNKEKKAKKFTDLEDIWKGKADFSFEEIQKAKIKLKETS